MVTKKNTIKTELEDIMCLIKRTLPADMLISI